MKMARDFFMRGDLQNSPATFYGGDLMQGGHDFLWGGDLPIKD